MNDTIIAALLTIVAAGTGTTLVMTGKMLMRFASLETTVRFIREDVDTLMKQGKAP